MAWYDIFSKFYDSSLEALFLDARRRAAEALDIQPDSTVLDLPAGTGQSFDHLQAHLGEGGHIVAVDLSSGMLDRARERTKRMGWNNISFVETSVHDLTQAQLDAAVGQPTQIDRLHCFLGMTVFPDMDAAFERLFTLLRPGGRFAVLDTHAEKPSLQGHMVNLMARADIRRRFWEPIASRCDAFDKQILPSQPKHGGELVLCTGRKT